MRVWTACWGHCLLGRHASTVQGTVWAPPLVWCQGPGEAPRGGAGGGVWSPTMGPSKPTSENQLRIPKAGLSVPASLGLTISHACHSWGTGKPHTSIPASAPTAPQGAGAGPPSTFDLRPSAGSRTGEDRSGHRAPPAQEGPVYVTKEGPTGCQQGGR